MPFTKMDDHKTVETEKLAYWFFRLNGCLTIENFIVHPDTGRDQRTDADLLGVRFPYRAEMLYHPMEDHAAFSGFGERPLLIIAEVKNSKCRLNGPWTKPDHRNMQRVLSAMGALPSSEIEPAAEALYQTDRYDGQHYAVRLFAMADEVGDLRATHPNAIPVTWSEALAFIFRRFLDYRLEKENHSQWDQTGQTLFEAFKRSWRTGSAAAFVKDIRGRLVDVQGRPVVRTAEMPDPEKDG